jgi:hypothetical protein
MMLSSGHELGEARVPKCWISWLAYAAVAVVINQSAVAQEGHYRLVDAGGSWRIYSELNAVSKRENYFLGTPAINNSDALFLLSCKKEITTFYFALEDKRLRVLPFGKQVSLTVRLANDEPFDVLAMSTGEGKLVVEERMHGPSFSLLLMKLYQNRPSSVGFSVGSLQWFYRADGFPEMADRLGEHCGFTPDPARAREGQSR